jgi:hypothetical protein
MNRQGNPFYFDDRVLAALCALAVMLIFWGVVDYDLRNPPCTECAWQPRIENGSKVKCD